MESQQPKVLVRPHQAKATKGKNVVIGEDKPDLRGKELMRKVAYEKTPDGREIQNHCQSFWTWEARVVRTYSTY